MNCGEAVQQQNLKECGESSMSVHEEQLTPHDEESEETESSVSVNPGSAEESSSTKERSEKRVISLQKHL